MEEQQSEIELRGHIYQSLGEIYFPLAKHEERMPFIPVHCTRHSGIIMVNKEGKSASGLLIPYRVNYKRYGRRIVDVK